MFIFDLDGVLVDACDWHKDALNEALKQVCGYQISQEEHIKTFNGLPTKTKLQILSENNILHRDKHIDVYNIKQQKTIDIINRKAHHQQEKIDLINFLKEKDFIVCCFTNSIRQTAELMLTKTGILDLFDSLVTNQDVKNPKPSPEGYIHLMEKFKVEKNMCYIVEDSPKGLKAAEASGANVIKVKNSQDLNLKFIRKYIV
tara:strand:+ start:44 stop:646 length:603 start_codon:yes stop_codon:yes gene_type:complete